MASHKRDFMSLYVCAAYFQPIPIANVLNTYGAIFGFRRFRNRIEGYHGLTRYTHQSTIDRSYTPFRY